MYDEAYWAMKWPSLTEDNLADEFSQIGWLIAVHRQLSQEPVSPIPYHFVFKRNETVLGSHRRHMWKFVDAYTIDLSADPDRTIDRRLILAIAVGMDVLQGEGAESISLVPE